MQVGNLVLLELGRGDVLALGRVVEGVEGPIVQVLEIKVGVLQDVEGLVSQDLSCVVFQKAVETLGELKLLTILARH